MPGFSFSRHQLLVACLLIFVVLQLSPVVAHAQNLGGTPQVNKAVQGQTAAQPEGAFLNLVNWVGNVICPVGAALCVVMAIVSYTQGRGAVGHCRGGTAPDFRPDAAH